VPQDGAAGPGEVNGVTWATAARAGDSRALGDLLEAHKSYLRSIARRTMPSRLKGKVDDLDLVQETLLEACLCFARFKGQSTRELRLWLRGILIRNVLDRVRCYCNTRKRSLGREQSLDAYRESIEPIDRRPNPCAQAAVQECLAALRVALDRLPADQRLVIELRNLDRLSFLEISQRLRRSPEAARKLWSRAVARLRRTLALRESS
jgi:RNA polymerase sigma-70 factor, ECF subfamily